MITAFTAPRASVASGDSLPNVRCASRSSSSALGGAMLILSMKRSFCASGSGYVPSYSIGFCVAKTVKFAGNAYVSRSIVTSRSCIACNSADCVFAGARLISSASKNEVNTGPLISVNSFLCRLKMLVPVMSAGIRSGVN